MIDSYIKWLKMISRTEPAEVVAQNMVGTVIDALKDAGMHTAAELLQKRLDNTVPLIQALEVAAQSIENLEWERANHGPWMLTWSWPFLRRRVRPWLTGVSDRGLIARVLDEVGGRCPAGVAMPPPPHWQSSCD